LDRKEISLGFLESLFGKKEKPEGEPFIPTPTQDIPGLEPIVVQAIENLYPNLEDQKMVFDYALKFYQVSKVSKKGLTRALLAVLQYSNGSTKELIDLDSPNLSVLIYRVQADAGYYFPNMVAAEKWVKSITKTQV
jgi:hypothetical protein